MLSPRDIRNLKNSFKKKSFGGGYDTQDVDQHLASLAERWESVLDDRRHAEEKVTELEGKLQHYEKVELALQEALETARDTARRTEESADRKARLIIEEAELRAQRIVQDAENERFGLRQDLATLTNRQTEVAARLRGFLMSELEILAQFQGEDPVGFIKLVAPDRSYEARTLEAPIDSPRLAAAYGEGPTDSTAPPPEAEEENATQALASGADDSGDDFSGDADFGDDADLEDVDIESARMDLSEFDAADDATIAMAGAGAMVAPLAPEAPVTSRTVETPAAPRSFDAPATPHVTEAPATPHATGAPAAPEAPEVSRPSVPSSPWLDTANAASTPSPWAITPTDAAPTESAPPGPDRSTPPAAPGWSSPVATFPPASGGDAPSAPASGEAPNGWSLRSLVTGESDESGSQAEREKIRRILDDLD